MTKRKLAGMICVIKDIIRSVYDDTFPCATILKSLPALWHFRPTQLLLFNP